MQQFLDLINDSDDDNISDCDDDPSFQLPIVTDTDSEDEGAEQPAVVLDDRQRRVGNLQ